MLILKESQLVFDLSIGLLLTRIVPVHLSNRSFGIYRILKEPTLLGILILFELCNIYLINSFNQLKSRVLTLRRIFIYIYFVLRKRRNVSNKNFYLRGIFCKFLYFGLIFIDYFLFLANFISFSL